MISSVSDLPLSQAYGSTLDKQIFLFIFVKFLCVFCNKRLKKKVICLERVIENVQKAKSTTAAGFEPARVTPVDFESTPLTTRAHSL